MPPSPRLRRVAVVAGITAVAALSGALGLYSWQQQRLPTELQTLQAVVERLSRGNDLGSQPISFMVSSGSYSAQLAEQRGLCKPDQCEMFAQLNPYHQYGNSWDELIRQGYALGDIQGWSTSSGTVILPRASFRAYGPHLGYLSCTVAHEIAHFRRHHVFQQSYQDSHKLAGLPEANARRASMAHSQQLELEADREAANMLARAGYRGRVCLQDLEFMYHSIGDGSKTDPDSTHPGYEERLAAMAAHYASLERKPPRPQTSRRMSFSYNAVDNLFTMTPKLR